MRDVNSSPYQRTWRKNLYSNVGYDDNYTDVSFLTSLRTNVNQRKANLKECFLSAGRVTEQVSIVFFFIFVYQVLVENIHKPTTVLIHSSCIACICYFYFVKVTEHEKSMFINHAKTVILFFILGYILSPVLKTLTETISTDTINATAFVMMIVHIIFFDYQTSIAISSRALSLNAAIFGSVCLASRVPTSFHAMVLLTVSVECFVLYPPFVQAIRVNLTVSYLIVLTCIVGLSVCAVSVDMCVTFLILVLFLNVVCPLLYVKLQNNKNNIYGPWDEAVPVVGRNKTDLAGTYK